MSDANTNALANAGTAGTFKRVFAQRSFIIAVAVLGLAAVGLNAGSEALQLHFKKKPVPVRVSFDDPQQGVPDRLGPWVKIAEQNTLDPDIQDALGTREFVFRNYVDSRVVGQEVVDELVRLGEEAEKATEDPQLAGKLQAHPQAVLLSRVQHEHPEAVMALAVTYYTGMVDTVAHIPERCMVSDGYEPRNAGTHAHTIGSYADGKPREVKFKFTTFEDQTGTGRVSKNVAYFFHCNGDYVAGPVDVRVRLQNLFQSHGYYAKVELMTVDPGQSRGSASAETGAVEAVTAKCEGAMVDILTHALPAIERCLPDWQAIQNVPK